MAHYVINCDVKFTKGLGKKELYRAHDADLTKKACIIIDVKLQQTNTRNKTNKELKNNNNKQTNKTKQTNIEKQCTKGLNI